MRTMTLSPNVVTSVQAPPLVELNTLCLLYTSITVKRTPVLMGRVEFGLLGHYNKYKRSPFETFDVGGDGMTGYSSYATESIALRGYENSSLTPYLSLIHI